MAKFQRDEHLSSYIERVRAIPRLSREDETALAIKAQAGDQSAADKIVEANLRHVIAIGLQYRRYGIPVSELVSEGTVGLMIAIGKFDPHRGFRFVTYAGYWIRAYVLECVVRHGRVVGGGTGPLRSKVFFRLRRERAQVSNITQDPEERIRLLAASFEMKVEKMREMLRRLDARDVSLDQPVYDESAMTMVDTMVSPNESAHHTYEVQERRAKVGARLEVAFEDLDERERYIIEQRLLTDETVSLAAIGRSLGVSRERARQLESRAKGKLRKHFVDLWDEAA